MAVGIAGAAVVGWTGALGILGFEGLPVGIGGGAGKRFTTRGEVCAVVPVRGMSIKHPIAKNSSSQRIAFARSDKNFLLPHSFTSRFIFIRIPLYFSKLADSLVV
jgi:hypothetical protein